MKNPSQAIKEQVDRSDLTQKEIAERIGTHEGVLSRSLNGIREFRASEVVAIAEVLHMPVSKLLDLSAYQEESNE